MAQRGRNGADRNLLPVGTFAGEGIPALQGGLRLLCQAGPGEFGEDPAGFGTPGTLQHLQGTQDL